MIFRIRQAPASFYRRTRIQSRIPHRSNPASCVAEVSRIAVTPFPVSQ